MRFAAGAARGAGWGVCLRLFPYLKPLAEPRFSLSTRRLGVRLEPTREPRCDFECDSLPIEDLDSARVLQNRPLHVVPCKVGGRFPIPRNRQRRSGVATILRVGFKSGRCCVRRRCRYANPGKSSPSIQPAAPAGQLRNRARICGLRISNVSCSTPHLEGCRISLRVIWCSSGIWGSWRSGPSNAGTMPRLHSGSRNWILHCRRMLLMK